MAQQHTLSVTGRLLLIRQITTLVELLGDDAAVEGSPLLTADDILSLFNGLTDALENGWYDETIEGVGSKQAKSLARYLRRIADRIDPS